MAVFTLRATKASLRIKVMSGGVMSVWASKYDDMPLEVFYLSALSLNRSVCGLGWVVWEGRQVTATPGDAKSRISMNMRPSSQGSVANGDSYFKYFLSVFGPTPACLHVVDCETPLEPHLWIRDSRRLRSTRPRDDWSQKLINKGESRELLSK